MYNFCFVLLLEFRQTPESNVKNPIYFKALASNDTGSAMTWGLRSGDAKFTTFLADRLLAEYTNSGR